MTPPEDDDVIDAEELGSAEDPPESTSGERVPLSLPEGIAHDTVLDAEQGQDDDGVHLDDAAVPPGTEPRGSDDEQRLVLYDPLRRYLQEVRRFEPLGPDEEHDLAVRYQKTGDVDAAYRLTTAHLRLVVRIAFDFKRTWLNLLDLIQEGNVGLLLAIRKFDPYRGIRLSTYAAWWIRAYIIKFLLDNWRLVKVGTTNARRRLLFNLRKEKDALLAQGIEPLPKLLAERLSVSEQDVVEVDRSLGMTDLSFEAKTSSDSDLVVGETLASSDPAVDTVYEEKERRDLLNRKLEEFAALLEERDRVVFRERLLADEPATLHELGLRFGLTREGLRQVEKRLLKRLREFLTAEVEDLRALDVTLPAGDDEPETTGERRRGDRPAGPRAQATTARRPASLQPTPDASASLPKVQAAGATRRSDHGAPASPVSSARTPLRPGTLPPRRITPPASGRTTSPASSSAPVTRAPKAPATALTQATSARHAAKPTTGAAKPLKGSSKLTKKAPMAGTKSAAIATATARTRARGHGKRAKEPAPTTLRARPKAGRSRG